MESILKHMKSHPDDYLRGHTGSDLLHDHLNWVQNKTGEYNKMWMANQPYGFAAYVRKAFEQKKTINKNAVTNFFVNKDKARLEKNVIAEVARLRR